MAVKRPPEIHFHAEEVEGVLRVQVGPFGEVVERDAVRRLAEAAIVLGRGRTGDRARVVFECGGIGLPAPVLGDLQVLEGPERHGSVARALGIGRRLVTLPEVPLERLADVLALCWAHAPLLFGVPRECASMDVAPPDLARSVAPSAEYLAQWRSLVIVFYHGASVTFSAPDLARESLLETVMACFRTGERPCVVSPEPM